MNAILNTVLDIVKRYLFEIICGVCAATGIVLIFLGLGGMSEITDEMKQALNVQTQIKSMAGGSKPINMKAVNQARERIGRIRSNYDRVMAFVGQSNKYEPLTNKVFPDALEAKDKIEFQKVYQATVDSWLDLLNAGDVPTASDITQERDRMEAEKPVDESLGATPVDREEPQETDLEKEPGSLEESAEVRAAIRNAKSIYCYATFQTFHQSDLTAFDGPMYSSSRPPTMTDIWHAQLGIWLQQSIVSAIAAINNAEVERLSQLDGDSIHPWVGNLPIKDIVSIQTTMYYVRKEQSGLGSQRGSDKDRAYPPGSAKGVFTGHESSNLYELMQFSVKLVVDARDIPHIVSEICRGNFHTPLRIKYEAIPPNLSMVGKIYGEEPVVTLVVDFETVFFSDLYLPLMPDEILKQLGKVRPKPPETEGA